MAESVNSLGAQLLRDAAGVCVEPPVVAPPLEDESGALGTSSAELSQTPADERAAIPLVRRLCEALRESGVSYCHWKSNWRLPRWLAGEGDLDLLVAERDAAAFTSVISAHGFRQVFPTRDRQVPGVLDFYGFDPRAARFVHLHVHYRLVLGHDLTKNFHLPIEKPFLESSDASGLLPVPSAEFELVLYVLRMVLKYAPAEAALRALLRPKPAGPSALWRELAYLEARASREGVREVLGRHLPFVETELFDACLASLRGGVSGWRRLVVRRRLERRLAAHARRRLAADSLLKSARRVTRPLRERVFGQSSRKRLAGGGALVALVGGDGAGKTTNIKELHRWLSKKFVVRRFHIGRPPRSPLTLAVICALRLRRLLVGRREPDAATNGAGRFPGYLQLLRWVCAARDRRRLYVRARRFASNGGVALCDRYPVERLRLMDGPNIARTVAPARRNRFVRFLLEAEARSYRHILPPDLLFVLRVHPETAVRRKTDESEAHVRTRSRELWEQDWRGTGAHLVDAGRPAAEVAAHLKATLWENL